MEDLLPEISFSPDVKADGGDLLEFEPQQTRYVTFFLGDALYGIAAECVAEVIRPPAVSLLPNSPARLAGIAAVRGTIVAIVDVKALFGHADKSPRDKAKLVLLTPVPGEAQLALRVDRMSEIIHVAQGREAKAEEALCPYISALAETSDGPARLIDLKSLSSAIAA